MAESVLTTETEKTSALKDYRQKLLMLKARIKHGVHALQGYKQHLKNGTFSRRMKSIKPYPKMNTPEAQTIVNTACDQVQGVILDQMIQEQELKQDQDSYQAIRQQREGVRQQCKATQFPKRAKKEPQTPTVLQLQQELRDLQSKYRVLWDLQSKYKLLCKKEKSTQ